MYYGVHIYQLIRYSRAYGSHQDCFDTSWLKSLLSQFRLSGSQCRCCFLCLARIITRVMQRSQLVELGLPTLSKLLIYTPIIYRFWDVYFVQLHVSMFSVPCNVRYDFHEQTMHGLSLNPLVLWGVHVLFICTHWHILVSNAISVSDAEHDEACYRTSQ